MTVEDPPGEEPWIGALGVNSEGLLVKEAISDTLDLPGFDAVEHRFYFVDAEDFPEVVGEGPPEVDTSTLAVYVGSVIHACHGDDVGSAFEEGDCELFLGRGLDPDEIGNLEQADADGYAEVSRTVPDDVRETAGQPLGRFPVFNPCDLPDLEYDHFLGPEAFGIYGYGAEPDEREPRGYW